MTTSTGPDRATVIVVRDRDRGCVVCGTHWSPTTQHRIPRGMGGSSWLGINRPSNLLTLCGSGTTGCHGWVEAHPIFSREAGWSLDRRDDPTEHPVLYPDGWFYLDDAGTRIPDPLTQRAVTGPRGRRGGSSRGWGEAGGDPDVGQPWAPATPGTGGPAGPLRPWGSARPGCPCWQPGDGGQCSECGEVGA